MYCGRSLGLEDFLTSLRLGALLSVGIILIFVGIIPRSIHINKAISFQVYWNICFKSQKANLKSRFLDLAVFSLAVNFIDLNLIAITNPYFGAEIVITD